ncbi:MAG TPA: ABC transporter permease [Rhizomicrobium sp.]|jgi:putative ABC transport system permease protein|nr:ABC transporter permease [Rhizomicrobium sp.]
MTLLRQIWTVSALNFRNLRQRLWQSLVIIVGMACVVGVLLSMLSLSEGMYRAYNGTGDPGRAIVVSEGANDEVISHIGRDIGAIIAAAPGIAKDGAGRPIADRDILVGVPATKKRHNSDSYIFLRGFGPQGFALRPDLKIVAGRRFAPGRRELIAGVGAQGQFAGMNIGDRVILPDGPWTIVGSFTSGRDILEGEIVGDSDTVMPAVRLKNYNSVIVRLASPDRLALLKKTLTSNPALSVTVERQTDWYHKINDQFYIFFSGVSYAIGAILGVGALFCTVNILYAAVSARTQEIATLRALGYGALPVAVSVLAEAILLSVTGALIGAAIAWLLYDGQQDSMWINVFYLTVSPALVGIGILWAVVVALLGGILPSIRAARRPVAEALRAT